MTTPPLDLPIQERCAELYRLGYDGPVREAPFFRHSHQGFDGAPGELGDDLMRRFNARAAEDPRLNRWALELPAPGARPRTLALIDASNDRLPTGPESWRVLADLVTRDGLPARVLLVNTREELLAAVADDPGSCLVFSECVDARAYDLALLGELEARGVVVIPGAVTAPGSIFTDKGATYDMLARAGYADKVARYQRVPPDGRDVDQVVAALLEAAEAQQGPWGTSRFFVKPVTGGSGVGGFRLEITPRGFFIPDLSKVTGEIEERHPLPMELPPDNEARVAELVWIIRMFESDPYYRAEYVHVDLATLRARHGVRDDHEALRRHLVDCEARQHERALSHSLSHDECHARLAAAIARYEAHFGKRYDPLLNEHIDFGAWGLRAHYRLSARGVQVETLYARIFQLALTEEGAGYVGSDNISNKHTGRLEPLRLTPIRPEMVRAVGGEAAFEALLVTGALATDALIASQPEPLRRLVPVRCQVDLAPISDKVGEGNADTARGQAIGTRWPSFVESQREWFRDGIRAWGVLRERLG
jgi:hypothetical protein